MIPVGINSSNEMLRDQEKLQYATFLPANKDNNRGMGAYPLSIRNWISILFSILSKKNMSTRKHLLQVVLKDILTFKPYGYTSLCPL